MYESNGKSWLKHIDFMVLDLICLEFCYIISFYIRFQGNNVYHIIDDFNMNNPYQRTMIFLVLIHLCIIIFAEPYSGILRRSFFDEWRKVFVYNIFILIGLVMLFFITHTSVLYSRIVVFLIPALNFVCMLTYRQIYKYIIRKRVYSSNRQDCILLVAPRSFVKEYVDAYNEVKFNMVKPVGVVLLDDDTDVSEVCGLPVVGNSKDMYEYARTNVVDEVLLYMGSSETADIVHTFNSMGITVHVCVESFLHMDKAMLNEFNGISVVTAYRNVMTPGQSFVKRFFDICAGVLGSLITVILTVFIAPMIWIQDPGPVFFRQERVGRNGRTFKMWKFRTMVVNADAMKKDLMDQNEVESGNMFKMDNDPRIIGINKKFSVGAFLRNTSLDEFPQFFNILTGSMSLIGTRPPTLDEYEQYQLHHKGRLALRPGLTGMWQVYGRSNITNFEKVVKLDKFYIDHCCFALDMKILLKTVEVVVKREGAK